MASSGNFCTLNRLPYSTSFRSNLDKGNLFSNPGNNCMGFGTMALTSGKKWYMEGIAQNAYNTTMGIFEINDANTIQNSLNTFYYNNTSYKSAFYHRDGTKYIDGSNSSYGATFAIGDVIGMAVDLESATNTITFYKNNASQGSFNLGTNGLDYLFCMARGTSGGGWFMNFGQDSTFGGNKTAGGNADANSFGDFFYAVPSGHLAVCSANLGISADIDPAGDDGADENPTKQFNVVTWTGDGTTSRSISVGFQPDFIWFKSRSSAFSHRLYDTSRGINSTGGKRLFSNSDAAEVDQTSGQDISAVGSDGFTTGASDDIYTNDTNDGGNHVAWCWKANGGTTASNTDGSMTSTVQANTKAGFSIVTYTGDGSDGDVGHGLDKAPEFVISKRRDGTGPWYTLHASVGVGYLQLDSNASFQSGSVPFGSSLPTASVVGATSANRQSGQTFILYCWHSVEGYSKFGKFEGNSNADGPFIYTGFRPRLVFCKAIDAAENWQVRDTARSPFNADSQVRIYWNSNAAEGAASTASPIDFLSNGFKVRGSNSEINTNTIVFGAWGDVPFKYNNTF